MDSFILYFGLYSNTTLLCCSYCSSFGPGSYFHGFLSSFDTATSRGGVEAHASILSDTRKCSRPIWYVPCPSLFRQGALGITKFKHQQRPTFFIYKQLTQLTLHFLRSSPTRTLNSMRSRTFNPHCTPRAYETMHRVHNSITTVNTEVSEILKVCKRAPDWVQHLAISMESAEMCHVQTSVLTSLSNSLHCFTVNKSFPFSTAPPSYSTASQKFAKYSPVKFPVQGTNASHFLDFFCTGMLPLTSSCPSSIQMIVLPCYVKFKWKA